MNNDKSGIGNLCLTLKDNEMFSIGDNITITVKQYSFKQIRISIQAPQNIRIERKGFYDEKTGIKKNIGGASN